jgi:chromosome segregation ATPase
MVIENAMYFTLGFLAAALLAIAIGPAFWHRAVRLTKRRIEAATPVTLAEFRADKDKLRAEFAITLRKHQLKIDALRNQISGNVVALDKAMTELAALRTERDEQFAAIGSLQTREQELVARIRDIERDSAALAARLRQADEDYSDIDPDLMPDASEAITGEQLTGDYRADVEDLLTALNIERQRNGYLEDQTRMLLVRLEKKKKSGLKDEAIAMLRDTLSHNDPESEARVALRRAEARISGAESRLNALLTESASDGQEIHENGSFRLLAEDFSEAEQSELLRAAVTGLEEAIMKDWETERFDAKALRSRLETIASDVSRLVYAGDAEDGPAMTESLFDKVRKFAADSLDVEELDARDKASAGGTVSDRMLAMRDRAAQ